MMIALYKINTYNETHYYYIHDYQGHLFSPFTFTAIWGHSQTKGREKSFTFESEQEMKDKISELIFKRLKEGYKLLYSYPQENQYQNIISSPGKQLVS
jgi:predicted DNA-binding WGR domain protein